MKGSTIITPLSLALFAGASRRPEIEWFYIQSGKPRHKTEINNSSQKCSSSSTLKSFQSTFEGDFAATATLNASVVECSSDDDLTDSELDQSRMVRGGHSENAGSPGTNGGSDMGTATIVVDDWISFKLDDHVSSSHVMQSK